MNINSHHSFSLQRANTLVKNQVHPTSIIAGYRLAMKECSKYIRDVLAKDIEKVGKETLINVAKTTLRCVMPSFSSFWCHFIQHVLLIPFFFLFFSSLLSGIDTALS
jgi:T-complex protein 1 subunit alpha